MPPSIRFIETLLSYDQVALLPISSDIPVLWLSMLKQGDIRRVRPSDSGKNAAHGLAKIITYNGTDFGTLAGTVVPEPESIVEQR